MMSRNNFYFSMWIVSIITLLSGCRSSPAPEDNLLDPPANVSGQALTMTQIKVTWVNPAYDVSPYCVSVEYKKSIDADYVAANCLSGVVEQTISGLAINTDYDFRLQSIALDNVKSEYSAVMTMNTSGNQTQEDIYPVMQNVHAETVAANTIKISWTWSNTNYSHLDSYSLERAPSGTQSWSTVIATTNLDQINPLVEATNFYSSAGAVIYRCKLNYTDGTSVYSSATNAVTNIPPLPAPTGFYGFVVSAGFGGIYNAELYWDYNLPMSNFSKFEIKYTVETSAEAPLATGTLFTTVVPDYPDDPFMQANITGYTTMCGLAGADHIQYDLQADPVNLATNAVSATVSTTLYCP